MKILFFNEYTAIRGGVDVVVDGEIYGLRKAGYDVELFEYKNSGFLSETVIQKLSTLYKSISGNLMLLEFNRVIDKFKPDIIHFHNIYTLFAFPIWAKLNKSGIKIIQHLHNYNPYCLNSIRRRDEKNCGLCSSKNSFAPGVLYSCYNNSLLKSSFLALSRCKPKTYNKLSEEFVDLFISPSEFLKEQYCNEGINPAKISVLHNFHLIEQHKFEENSGRKVLFIGNMIIEKGLKTLVELIKLNPEIQFFVAGEGKDKEWFLKMTTNLKNLKYTGYIEGERKAEILRESTVVIFPTEIEEPAPVVPLEAMASGKPVISALKGGIPEYVQSEKSGIFVEENCAKNYSEAILSLINDSEILNDFSRNAFNRGKEFSLEMHIKNLVKIYESF
ncbi:MAG: glycosyltransferase family 4 protein [Ignavibacteriaceae bacterium]|nr:glycosyltransferase family 4 protein [Ignavibacteriaceae bacterium]